jgi:lipopolysaccharide transport system permease protein
MALVGTIARRDLRAKYAQTVLGWVWTLFQPLMALAIFTLFFNILIDVEVPGGNYAVYAFTGMIAWFFFSYIVHQGGTSLLQGTELIRKMQFPKMVLPLSKVVLGLVELIVSLILLIGLMVFTGEGISIRILWLPVFILLNAAVGLSIAIWLCIITIRRRDLQHLIPYLVNFGIWLTPVFYPVTLIPKTYHFFLALNPMVGIIEGFRWCLLGTPYNPQYFIGILFALILLFVGLIRFKSVEDYIADHI